MKRAACLVILLMLSVTTSRAQQPEVVSNTCSECDAVLRGQPLSPNLRAPTFVEIANKVFADATRQNQSQYVKRARKSDRLNVRSVLQEPVLLPFCEPLASEFADPILGRVVGRCDA
jgi:hypothetical protein